MTDMVFNMLGISWQEQAGILVVGVDYSDWSPVAGAEVLVMMPMRKRLYWQAECHHWAIQSHPMNGYSALPMSEKEPLRSP